MAIVATTGLVSGATVVQGQALADGTWVVSWAAPIIAGTSGSGPSNATARNLVRVQLQGSQIRIRLSNAGDPTVPLVVGSASVAHSSNAPSPQLAAGTSKPITFNGGKPGITVAPGVSSAYSDPVDFPVSSQDDLAISLFLPAALEPSASASNYAISWLTSNGAGDSTGNEQGTAFTSPTQLSTYGLTAVDVFTSAGNSAIVAFGSSTFNGANSVPNGHSRVEDLIGARGVARPDGHRRSVVAAGKGGDTLHAGLDRIYRDAFSQSGVTGVILYNINLCAAYSPAQTLCYTDATQVRTLEQVQADYRVAAAEAHVLGITVLCSSWAPESTTTAYVPERDQINQWILSSRVCDDTVDWSAVLRAPGPAGSYTYNPEYYSDSIHPNQLGHTAMAAAVPDSWFTDTVSANPSIPKVSRPPSSADSALPNTAAVADWVGIPLGLALVILLLMARQGITAVRKR